MPHPSQQELLEWFTDGIDFLVWKMHPANTSIWPGCRAGTRGLRYHQTTFKGKKYYTHRLLWILRHGEIPDGYRVDHKDSDGFNNADYNLRLCTPSQNSQNRYSKDKSTGIKGVYFDAGRGKYTIQVWKNGEHFMQRFDTLAEAISAVRSKREELHGEFCNHG